MTQSKFISVLLLITAICLGCQRSESASSYEAPKDAATQFVGAQSSPAAGQPAGATPSSAKETQPSSSDRMLAAIVPTDARVWFFKMMGPSESVEKQAANFRSMIESVTFTAAAANPKWKLPEGWTVEQGGGMRFATLKSGDGDVSVISLPPGQDVNANIDRWRGQLRLPPRGEDDQPERIKIGDYEAYLVDLVGKTDPSKMMAAAPFAGGRAAPAAPAAAQPVADSLKNSPAKTAAGFTFDKPADWTEGKAGGMRKAAFNVTQGDESAEVTVITLPGTVGGALSNVNRWRGQVGLDPISDNQLEATLDELKVGGLDAKLVDLVGSEVASERKSMLAVMLMNDGTSWFFKMMGPADLVAQQKASFVQFVESVSFTD